MGSEKRQVLGHARPASRDVALLSRSGTQLRQRAVPFPNRLCATASARRRSADPLAARYRIGRWLLRKSAGWWRRLAATVCNVQAGWRLGRAAAALGVFQAPAGTVWWRWSLSRLWVAVISRHSERHADLPRRWKRSMRRLNFVSANTGSIIPWRFR